MSEMKAFRDIYYKSIEYWILSMINKVPEAIESAGDGTPKNVQFLDEEDIFQNEKSRSGRLSRTKWDEATPRLWVLEKYDADNNKHFWLFIETARRITLRPAHSLIHSYSDSGV